MRGKVIWIGISLLVAYCRASTQTSSEVLDVIHTVAKRQGPTDHRPLATSYTNDGSGDAPKPTVMITQGKVYGMTYPESHIFYAIPYAKPPVYELRWMPTQEALNFSDGMFDASVETHIACEQVYAACEEGVCDNDLSEDCLVLDVNVPLTVELSDPNKPPSAQLPVMMYNHGGFFYAGSGTTPQDSGRYLSNATNAIIVTVNSRIGPFGFLYYKDNTTNTTFDGNQGLEDQRMALKWIQTNIASFGGDPNKVTIFGESSGAQATMFHVLSRKSEPYFVRVIMESNPAVFKYPDQQGALRITNYLMDAVNCSDIECLKTMNATVIAEKRNAVIGEALKDGDVWGAVEPYRPMIDGVEFQDQPLNLFQTGNWLTNKRMIIGTNHQELAFVYSVFENRSINQLEFKKFNQFMLGDEIGDMVSDQYLQYVTDEYNTTTVLGVELTDMWFTCPTRALARFASNTYNGTDGVYLYDNAYPMGGPGCYAVMTNPAVCGYSFHSSELPFVFKTGPSYGMTFTENDTLVSDMFSEYWGNFAHFGDPSSISSSNNASTAWPTYQVVQGENMKQWSNIYIAAPQSSVEFDYRKEMCDFWDSTGFYVNITNSTTDPPTTTTTNTISTTTITTTTTTAPTTSPTTSAGQKATPLAPLSALFVWYSLFIWSRNILL